MRSGPRTAVVGAGRLARALVPALLAAGHGPVVVLSPGARSARALAKGRRGVSAGSLDTPLPPGVGLVLFAVPDDDLADAARTLARSGAAWNGKVVLHTAGALGPAPLAALARRGASVGVLHPLQVLGSDARAARERLRGSLYRVEGSATARRAAARLARDLGGTPVTVSRRALYHAAASLASNDVVALLDLAAQAFRQAGLPPARARDGALALAEGALAQARAGGVGAALTGPVARGDARTLRRQLAALRALRGSARVHAALSLHLAGVAARLGRLDPARRRAIERTLSPR